MQYNQYITKKRCKIVGIGGNVNIPYGTICDVVDGYILYKNKIVCARRSQNGKIISGDMIKIIQMKKSKGKSLHMNYII